MLQTIDRALTIYGNMSLEEQHMFLQAGPDPLSNESQKLSTKCFDIMERARKLMKTIKSTLPKISEAQLKSPSTYQQQADSVIFTLKPKHTILTFVEVECRKMYRMIPQERIPIFLSAMMYYICDSLKLTDATEIYATVKIYCKGVLIPEIYPSKRPISADGVVQLVNSKTETFDTISTETTISTPNISTDTKQSRCTIS